MYIYNDYELLYLIRRKSEIAYNILLLKYSSLINKRLSLYNFNQMTKEDIVQDCLMEIPNSINKFDENYNVLFITYIDLIFQRKIRRVSSKIFVEQKNISYMLAEKNTTMKEETLLYEDSLRLMVTEFQIKKLYSESTMFEKEVIKHIMFGKLSLDEFAIKYNISKKRLYNLIQQIRKKCSTIINSEQFTID